MVCNDYGYCISLFCNQMALPTQQQLNDPAWQSWFSQVVRRYIMTKEVAERLERLKANLAGEPDKTGLYAQDLKASIKSCEQALKNDGFMVLKGK